MHSHSNLLKKKIKIYIIVTVIALGAIFFIYKFAFSGVEFYQSEKYKTGPVSALDQTSGEQAIGEVTLPSVNTHLETPEPLKGIYVTSWVAGAGDGKGGFPKREAIVKLVDNTEINAVVIDIKDATGFISFEVQSPDLKKLGTDSNRISDIEEFIKELHEHNIYVIGRVAVFQDPQFVKIRPDLAVKSKKTGEV